jgi:hypothetical protein
MKIVKLRHSCDNGSPTTAVSAFAMPKPYSLDLRERVNIRPGRAIKHFTAYDPVAKWTLGHVSTAASASGR